MTENRDLKLDTLTHDLQIARYDLQLVDNIGSTAQRLKVRLKFFLTEWFLDRRSGVPYLQEILEKSPDLQYVENIFKTVILTTPRVIQLTSFSLDYDNLTRRLIVTFSVLTDDGEIIFNEVLP
jgi:hypothetical protein